MYNRQIYSTLRPDELPILDEWAKKLDELEYKRVGRRYGRAGVIRLAIRYALEHRSEVEEWMQDDRNRR